MYVILKTKQMIYVEDWSITLQNVVADKSTLKHRHDFSDPHYDNLSLAI